MRLKTQKAELDSTYRKSCSAAALYAAIAPEPPSERALSLIRGGGGAVSVAWSSCISEGAVLFRFRALDFHRRNAADAALRERTKISQINQVCTGI